MMLGFRYVKCGCTRRGRALAASDHLPLSALFETQNAGWLNRSMFKPASKMEPNRNIGRMKIVRLVKSDLGLLESSHEAARHARARGLSKRIHG